MPPSVIWKWPSEISSQKKTTRARKRCAYWVPPWQRKFFGSGEYYLDGMAIHETKEDDLTMVRNQKIGFIFQNYQLIPTYNVMQNIIMPLLMRGMTHEEAESIHCQSTGGTAGDPVSG